MTNEEFELISKIVNDEFMATPDYVVAVGWGAKYKDGKILDENCVSYTVEKKLPIELIPEGELIPKTITYSGKTFNTDVIEGSIQPMQTLCDPYTYQWRSVAPLNRNLIRPIQGGTSTINYTKFPGYKCTLGFIAVDNDTNSLVGVSNNHCYCSDATYVSLRNINGLIENQYQSNVVQSSDYTVTNANIIGKVKKYVPLTGSAIQYIYNRVDGACTTLNQADIDPTQSWKQYGLTGWTQPMKFATTSEINSLVGLTSFSSSPNLYSSGRTTGPKGEPGLGSCRLKLDGFPVTVATPYRQQGVSGAFVAYFEQQIRFRLECPSYTATSQYCFYPINGGDSGSALLADIGGERKILGLVYAGSVQNFGGIASCYRGYANRIDEVASQLNLSAWTGQTVNYTDINDSEFVCSTITDQKTIVLSGKTFWQLGYCT